MHVTALSLSAFRNYDHLSLPDLPPGPVAFVGPNGAGKTSLMEAISLLSPGRGLRGAENQEMQNRAMDAKAAPWGIHATITGRYGVQDLGIGVDPATGRRIVHLNGGALKHQTERADLVRCVWLTPAFDRVFMDGAGGRRRLIDRWAFTADPAHAGRITRYERLVSERNRLLAHDKPDALWCDALEQDIAETGMAIAVARVDYLDRLKKQIAVLDGAFPAPSLMLSGFLEDRIGDAPALAVEQEFRACLARNRTKDKELSATTTGPHRSDVIVHDQGSGMPAAVCSTGEQKALLFSLFLAHTALVRAEWGQAPLLLLDEVMAHLDPTRRAALLGRLLACDAQIFMTATNADTLSFGQDVHVFPVEQGRVMRRQYLKAA